MTAQELIDLIRAETAAGGNTRARVADALEAILAISGQPGQDGSDGVGIASIVDNQDGTMTIVLTDDSTYVVELPTGQQGEQGEPGQDGAAVIAIQVILDKDYWVNNEQTVTATGVTATNVLIIRPDASSDTNYMNYLDHQIRAISQATNSVTFKCALTPLIDITANVLIL